ncbi:hypothetical protein [Streptomyces sp. DSM 118878]
MGVFARFRRKAKGGDEESTTGSGAATPTAESESAEVSATPATASPEAVSAEEKPAEGAGDDTKSAAADGKVTQTAESAGTDAADSADSADGVEIPKQQSADEAADNEADEGARN